MVRPSPWIGYWTRRSPHVRGDGPTQPVSKPMPENVLPTCVGMVRKRRSPERLSLLFSPRAWGWSDMARQSRWYRLAGRLPSALCVLRGGAHDVVLWASHAAISKDRHSRITTEASGG